MFCYVASAVLCSGITLRFATLRYVCYAMLFYVTLSIFCYVSNITFAMLLLLVTFITLHYATPWQAVALWYAMLRYDMLYYVTVICAVFLRVVD